ncbi:MAG TPA: protein kinase [Opitutales bacterium]|jgi:predicted Ser/Thr protein kinase|nr:protein kinase [Opitutales bacterium]
MQAGFPTGPVTTASSTSTRAPRWTPPTPVDLGPLFPQLEILELIGQGGMGAVYKARQPALDRFVALKILPSQTGEDPGFAGRFAREARALARLSHPGIVAIYDFGQAVNFHYFIMEYVDGASLRQIERAGRLTPREALQIIPQICSALQFAHDEGIVHRDIKPENILLDKKGRVKIADFGLAKIFSPTGGAEPAPPLTEAGHVMGTPHYMAPEQVERPQEVDHRADIYSLGVVFYEMLTGELPLGKFAVPSEKAATDTRLDDVVLRTLEKEPAQRYQHASEVRTAVETIAGADAEESAPARRPWKYFWVAAVMLTLGFLFTDSADRLIGIWNTTKITLSNMAAPAADPTSPTGYAGNQHVQVMPALGTDGYHWILQTEQMLNQTAGPGAGLRVRQVDYDGLPGGREVHWSSSLHWLLASLAWVDHVVTGAPMAIALERTEPWANTFVLALLIVLVPAVVARRFGPVAAAVLAVCFICVYPSYEFYFVGYFDHHGLAASCDMLMVLFLLLGGAGAVRGAAEVSQRWSAAERTLWDWLPERKQARRWFIASGIAGGAGLWISAASVIPPMFGLGFAALLSSWLLPDATRQTVWRAEPSLWRGWGITGAATSLFFYFLEYFPSHLSWRLEVNHPLYALAWLAAGDMLARLGRMMQPKSASAKNLHPLLNGGALVLDFAVFSLPLLAVLIYGDKVFSLLPGTFLLNFHFDYILEFRSFIVQMTYLSPLQMAGGISIIPFAIVPVFLLLLTPKLSRPWRALLLTALLPVLVMLTIALLQIRWLGLTCAVSAAELAVTAFVVDKIWSGIPWEKIAGVSGAAVLLSGVAIYFSPAGLAIWLAAGGTALAVVILILWTRGDPTVWVFGLSLLGLAVIAVLIATIPSLWDNFKMPPRSPVSNLSINNLTSVVMEFFGILLGAAVVATLPALLVAGVGTLGFGWAGRKRVRTMFTGMFLAFLALVILPFPIFTAYQWFASDFNTNNPPSELDLTQIVTRDVSQRLRMRLGDEHGAVLSGPTTTTWMMYYGGFRGLGTLYWENTDGMKASAAIYSAKTDDEAFRLIQQNHITHIAIFSWDAFAEEYPLLNAGLRRSDNLNEVKQQEEQIKDSFVIRLLRDHNFPNWLRPLPYRIPNHPWLKTSYVYLFEIVPPQSDEEAQLRKVQWMIGLGTAGGTNSATNWLKSLMIEYPNYLPYRVTDALLKKATGDKADYQIEMPFIFSHINLASQLAFDDRVDYDLAISYNMTPGFDSSLYAAIYKEVFACLDQATGKNFRLLPSEKLAAFLRLVKFMDAHPPVAAPNDVIVAKLTPAENKSVQLGLGLLSPALQNQIAPLLK